jgi:dephospho-CoA kinase
VLIGITGGIGAGKSHLVEYFRRRGAAVVDADQIGHFVIEETSVKQQLLAQFGDEIVDDSGKLDRRILGRKAFYDQDSYEGLNQVVQPALASALWKEVEEIRSRGARILVVEASVLFEWGNRRAYDKIVVVEADEEERIRRIVHQGRLSREEIQKRMSYQLSADEKRAMADHVIINDGTLSDLECAAESLWRELLGETRAPGKQDDGV